MAANILEHDLHGGGYPFTAAYLLDAACLGKKPHLERGQDGLKEFGQALDFCFSFGAAVRVPLKVASFHEMCRGSGSRPKFLLVL